MKILRLRKCLALPVELPSLAGMRLRSYGGADDIARWLGLREASFTSLAAGGRPWTADDFQREFLDRPWWTSEAMWLAEAVSGLAGEPPGVVGSVTLGRSGRPPTDTASIQWLMVAPEYRRRGIGTALVSVVERAALERGVTELSLETHADWREAVRLYERLGYAPS